MLLYKIINDMSEKAAEQDKNYRLNLKRRVALELKKIDEEYNRTVMLNAKRNARSKSFN